jgi:hypothetical protein
MNKRGNSAAQTAQYATGTICTNSSRLHDYGLISQSVALTYTMEVLLLLTPPLLAPERVPWAANLFRRARNRGLVLSPGPLEGGAGVAPPTAASPAPAIVTVTVTGAVAEDVEEGGTLLAPAGGREPFSVRLRPFLPPTPDSPLPSGAFGLGMDTRLGFGLGLTIGFKALSPDPVLTPVAGGGTGLWGTGATWGVSKGDASSP